MSTRLYEFLNRNTCFVPSFPDQLDIIRKNIPQLDPLTDLQVEYLYREFSEDTACAGWLRISDEQDVADFAFWLNEEI